MPASKIATTSRSRPTTAPEREARKTRRWLRWAGRVPRKSNIPMRSPRERRPLALAA